MCAGSLVGVPAATTASVTNDGSTSFEARVSQSNPPENIESSVLLVANSAPSPANLSASGSETNSPNASGSAISSGSVLLSTNVFALDWTGDARVTTTGTHWPPQLGAYALLRQAPENTVADPLAFTLTGASPVTLHMTGSLATSGPGGASAQTIVGLWKNASTQVFYQNWVVVDPNSQQFEFRFSEVLEPGNYSLQYISQVSATEYADSSNASNVTLQLVLTMAPAGACSDGSDNDGDGLIDLEDPECANGLDDSEGPPSVPVISVAGIVILVTLLGVLGLAAKQSRPSRIGSIS